MNRQLRLVLYVEGMTDQHFLPILVRRLAIDIILKPSSTIVDVLDPEIITLSEEEKIQDRDTNILLAAQKAIGFDILVVHSDVDKRTWQETYNQLIAPGFAKVEQARDQQSSMELCDGLVPLIPQRMIEAWVIAHGENLRKSIGTDKSVAELGLPSPREIERRADPKGILENAIRIGLESRPRRNRTRNKNALLNVIYTRMGEEADLLILRKLPSFQKFEQALSDKLVELGFVI